MGEDYELRLWIHHGTGGMPHLPTTADQVEYGGLTWKVTQIDPTYSSKDLIASKIICEAQLMAKKWDGSKVIKEIDEALDRATAQFLTNTRSKLSAASPVLTGRLASSWNIGRNQPDLSAPPVREKQEPD